MHLLTCLSSTIYQSLLQQIGRKGEALGLCKVGTHRHVCSAHRVPGTLYVFIYSQPSGIGSAVLTFGEMVTQVAHGHTGRQ